MQGVLTNPRVHSVQTGSTGTQRVGIRASRQSPVGAILPQPRPRPAPGDPGRVPQPPPLGTLSVPIQDRPAGLRGSSRAWPEPRGSTRTFRELNGVRGGPQDGWSWAGRSQAAPSASCSPRCLPLSLLALSHGINKHHSAHQPHGKHPQRGPQNKQSPSCPPSHTHLRRAPASSTYWPELPAGSLLPIIR